MNKALLKALWLEEEAKTFEGWDFSYLNDRIEEEVLPWDYKTLVDHYLRPAHHLLDMGTGGGEFLMTLGHPYTLTSVTEGYEPNVDLCKKRLGPLGVEVKQVYEDNQLPFDNQVFDVVINRHEAYDLQEVYRVLKPGGLLITQQVGAANNLDFSNALLQDRQRLLDQDHFLEPQVKAMSALGFQVLYENQSFPYLKFRDIGALVYFAKIISWEFIDFSVERDLESLYALQEVLDREGSVSSTEHRFIMIGQKSL